MDLDFDKMLRNVIKSDIPDAVEVLLKYRSFKMNDSIRELAISRCVPGVINALKIKIPSNYGYKHNEEEEELVDEAAAYEAAASKDAATLRHKQRKQVKTNKPEVVSTKSRRRAEKVEKAARRKNKKESKQFGAVVDLSKEASTSKLEPETEFEFNSKKNLKLKNLVLESDGVAMSTSGTEELKKKSNRYEENSNTKYITKSMEELEMNERESEYKETSVSQKGKETKREGSGSETMDSKREFEAGKIETEAEKSKTESESDTIIIKSRRKKQSKPGII